MFAAQTSATGSKPQPSRGYGRRDEMRLTRLRSLPPLKQCGASRQKHHSTPSACAGYASATRDLNSRSRCLLRRAHRVKPPAHSRSSRVRSIAPSSGARVSEPDVGHLLPFAKKQALASNEERIRFIRADRWIGYTRAQAALAALDELMSCPMRSRMPNLVLVGATNNGKTMIIERFCRAHAQGAPGHSAQRPFTSPVLRVQMPRSADERRFFGGILAHLGVDESCHQRLFVNETAILKLISRA